MSNEYKDWLNDQKEQNKVIFNQLRSGKHPFVGLEELEFFIPCIADLIALNSRVFETPVEILENTP